MTSFSLGERVKVKKIDEENISKYQNVIPMKGEEDGYCNVTSCTKSFANFHNNVDKKWYCRGCALRLEGIARKDNKSLYKQLEGTVINGYA